MKKRWTLLPILLLLLLCACSRVEDALASDEIAAPVSTALEESGESTAPAAPKSTPEPAPEPTPKPAPEPRIETWVRLKKDPLPEEYRLLDYAACSNSTLDAQTFIDTGVIPTNNTRFYLDFACTSGFTVKDTWFFGCFDRDKHMYMEVGFHQSQGNPAHFYTATGVQYSQTEDSALRTVAWFKPGNYYYADVLHGRKLYAFDEPVEQHLFLFSRQHMDREIAGTHDIFGHYDLNIYACRIWQDGELVRDYVPCQRVEDGRVGMYDLVEGRVYFSDGTDELLPGEPAVSDGRVKTVSGRFSVSLKVPQLQGYVFRGYYTLPNGEGECVINAKGIPCAGVGTEEGLTLYAWWTRDEAWFDRY